MSESFAAKAVFHNLLRKLSELWHPIMLPDLGYGDQNSSM